jgi:hypothetical protein
MRMKAAPGALLWIMVLMGCAAPARFNTPAGTPEAVKTGVTGNGEALASAGGVRQARTAGLPDSPTAGVGDAAPAVPAVQLADANGVPASAGGLQRALEHETEELPEELEEYDPWQRFNRKMFWFNREVDRFVLKPMEVSPEAIHVPTSESLRDMVDIASVAQRLLARGVVYGTRGTGGHA